MSSCETAHVDGVDSDVEFYTPQSSQFFDDSLGGICAHIQALTSINEQDKQGVLWVLAQNPDCMLAKRHLQEPWQSKCLDWHHATTMAGIDIAKMYPKPPDKMYKARGIGEIPVPPQVLLEMIIVKELMKKWDPLLLDVKFYDGVWCEKEGTARLFSHAVVGVPGFSSVFYNRELYVSITLVILPNGGFVVYIHGLGDSALPPNTVTPPRTVRATVGDSGWLALPRGSGTHTTLLAQVDPKGWVPSAVVNLVSTLIPMNIDAIRKALKKVPGDIIEDCRKRRLQEWAASFPSS